MDTQRAGRRHERIVLSAPLQRVGDESGGLELLEHRGQIGDGSGASLGNADGLLDRHEAAIHHAQSGIGFGEALQRRLDAGGDLEDLAPELSTASGPVGARTSSACSIVRVRYRS